MEIVLDGLDYHAFHGVFEHERAHGGRFGVQIFLTLTAEAAELAARTDHLRHTVDYGSVAELAAQEMAQPRKLIETVADSIAQRIWTSYAGRLTSVRVRVEKHDPPGMPGARATVEARRG